MDSTYVSTVRLLAEAELAQAIAFYHYVVTKRVVEIGSSSIHPDLAKGCSEIRELMRNEFQIVQYNEEMSLVLTLFGDTAARLYFGGKQYIRPTNKWRQVSAREYIELLATKITALSEDALVALEVIAQDSVSMSQAPRTPLKFDEI